MLWRWLIPISPKLFEIYREGRKGREGSLARSISESAADVSAKRNTSTKGESEMKTKIRRLSMAAFVGGLVVISAGLSGSGNSGTDNLVKIDNFSFAPTTLTIKAGTEVR